MYEGLQRYRTGIGIGDTGISLPTPIPSRGIADMTVLEKDNYYAFATAEAILTPYLKVTDTPNIIYICQCLYCVGVRLLLHITINSLRCTIFTKGIKHLFAA